MPGHSLPLLSKPNCRCISGWVMQDDSLSDDVFRTEFIQKFQARLGKLDESKMHADLSDLGEGAVTPITQQVSNLISRLAEKSTKASQKSKAKPAFSGGANYNVLDLS